MPPRRQTTAGASPAPQQQAQAGAGASQQQQTGQQTSANGYSANASLALPGSSQTWNRGSIPIDPALQSASAQQYSNYYQQYQQQYGTYAAQFSQLQAQQSVAASRAATQTSGSGGGGGGGGSEDITNMNDVLGAAGVDLRAEEEGLQRSHSIYRAPSTAHYPDRVRKQIQNNPHIGTALRTIAAHHSIAKVPEESVHYITYALQARLEELLVRAIAAAQHRKRSQLLDPAPLYDDGSPMWNKVIRRDVGKQLAVMERIEREEEMRIRGERKAREEAADTSNKDVSQAPSPHPGTDDDNPRKKRKKDLGPGVIAKTMSEETRKRMSNAAASHAAGFGNKRYAWMNAGGAGGKTGAAKTPTSTTPATTPGKTGTADQSATPATQKAEPAKGGWARGRVVAGTQQKDVEDDTRLQVTLKDMSFAIHKERGHGGGRGSARGWT